MKKKNIVCIALTAVLSLSAAMLAACGEKKPQPTGGGNAEYPATDYLDPLYSGSTLTNAGKGRNSTHDPVLVEAKADGKSVFYAFSTDNDQYGVQIRKSDNLYEWSRVGVAIEGFTTKMSGDDVKKLYQNGNAELQDVFKVVSSLSGWNNDCWTLWAPDVVPATSNKDLDANGEWWLYSCWTSGFGSEHSVIFKCKSANGIEGPYQYEGIVVQDATGDGSLNEIDPSVFYTPDGKMYLSYGSYFGGFGIVELDSATGLRPAGTSATTPGTKTLANVNAEGSAINRHTVKVYSGDIAADDYDESKWTEQSKYYMMGSWGALAYNYNMRVWTSDTPDGAYTSERGTSGLQVSGTWTWRKADEGGKDGTLPTPAKDKDLNFYIPGHNDMLTTSDGRNLIVYHSRVSEGMKTENKVSVPSYAEGEHFLRTSLYDFNSKGQLVINPNQYAGEKVGTVKQEELLSKTNGKFSMITLQSRDNASYSEKAKIYHAEDCELTSDGKVKKGETEVGTWKFYGDHYIYLKIDGVNYYGSVMPALIRQYDESFGVLENKGLTISAISDLVTVSGKQENNILYMNMRFE